MPGRLGKKVETGGQRDGDKRGKKEKRGKESGAKERMVVQVCDNYDKKIQEANYLFVSVSHPSNEEEIAMDILKHCERSNK